MRTQQMNMGNMGMPNQMGNLGNMNNQMNFNQPGLMQQNTVADVNLQKG